MDRKTIAVGFMLLYVIYRCRQFVSWIQTERKKYRNRQRKRVTTKSDYENKLNKLCGCDVKTQMSNNNKSTSESKCGNKYNITYSPENLYVGHQDYGAYYAVVVIMELVFVIGLSAYIYWM